MAIEATVRRAGGADKGGRPKAIGGGGREPRVGHVAGDHRSEAGIGWGDDARVPGELSVARFVVQLHDATSLHYDLRLEIGGVLRSWAVPKGPSLDPAVRRLAVPVADHDLAAGDFEGVHAGAARGSGAVIVWDEGTVEVLTEEPEHLSFALHGVKLAGRFGLTRTGARRWILVKAVDEHARSGSELTAERPASVRSGRTWQDLADAPRAAPADG